MKVVTALALVLAVFFAPLIKARITHPPTEIGQIAKADAALVFGALVRNGQISPLHAERLDAAIDLWRRQLVSRIVVSNAQQAALVMANYLKQAGVPDEVIEIDGHADQTPDTCRNEYARTDPRQVIFVSQGFHIPRLSMQCKWAGITGPALATEAYRAPGSTLSTWETGLIRTKRHLREAALLWAATLGLYDRLSPAAMANP